MKVHDLKDLDWSQILVENQCVIVSYLSTTNCPICETIDKAFFDLSKGEKYKKIKFLRINSSDNIIAEEYINKKKLPFTAVFKNGFLVECDSIRNESDLTDMLDRLNHFEFKIV
jgi:hypothetical protein